MTPAIEIRQLRKTFKVGFSGLKKVEALRGLDLEVQPGEIYGFLGPNGAGKSTTIKALTRLILPTSGEALVFGEPLTRRTTRARVGFLPETPSFYEFLTGTELLGYYASLLGLSRAEGRRQGERLLDRVGLASAASLQIRRYSKGMVQRIGIAQALLGDPELVILDEPVAGLDPVGRREMRELILELKAQGKTVFFSTHVIPDVELVCDRVGIIIAGRMVREGTVAELLGDGLHETEIMLENLDAARANSLAEGVTARPAGGALSLLVPADIPIEPILAAAIEAGAKITSVNSRRRELEEIFIAEITTNREDDQGPRASVGGAK